MDKSQRWPLTHGLIVDQPWIQLIICGNKSWEMRANAVKRRGPVALIAKGTGTVVGVAHLVDVRGPFSSEGKAW